MSKPEIRELIFGNKFPVSQFENPWKKQCIIDQADQDIHMHVYAGDLVYQHASISSVQHMAHMLICGPSMFVGFRTFTYQAGPCKNKGKPGICQATQVVQYFHFECV